MTLILARGTGIVSSNIKNITMNSNQAQHHTGVMNATSSFSSSLMFQKREQQQQQQLAAVATGSEPKVVPKQIFIDNIGSQEDNNNNSKVPKRRSRLILNDDSTNDEQEVNRSVAQHQAAEKSEHNDGKDAEHSLRDVEFEINLLSQRNKRVLFSRLAEVAPRGKLSMVSYRR